MSTHYPDTDDEFVDMPCLAPIPAIWGWEDLTEEEYGQGPVETQMSEKVGCDRGQQCVLPEHHKVEQQQLKFQQVPLPMMCAGGLSFQQVFALGAQWMHWQYCASATSSQHPSNACVGSANSRATGLEQGSASSKDALDISADSSSQSSRDVPCLHEDVPIRGTTKTGRDLRFKLNGSSSCVVTTVKCCENNIEAKLMVAKMDDRSGRVWLCSSDYTFAYILQVGQHKQSFDGSDADAAMTIPWPSDREKVTFTVQITDIHSAHVA